MNCAPLTIQRSDPIISPGIPSAHVHAIIGGNAFNRNMKGTLSVFLYSPPLFSSLALHCHPLCLFIYLFIVGIFAAANATATTCNKGLDHSNYWIPQMYYYHNNQYELVEFQGMTRISPK